MLDPTNCYLDYQATGILYTLTIKDIREHKANNTCTK